MSFNDGESAKKAEGGHGSTHSGKVKKGAKPKAKRTTLDAAKKALNPKGKKGAKSKPAKPEEPLFKKPRNAAEKAEQNEDAKASVEALVKKYQAIESAESNASRIGKAAGQANKAAMSTLKETIEQGIDINANPNAYKDKCDAIGLAWQQVEEAKTKGAQERRDAGKLVKAARDAMKKEVDDSRQLALTF